MTNNKKSEMNFTVDDIKKDFGENYDQILQMENAPDISGLIDSIEKFVEKRFFNVRGDEFISTHQLRNIYSKVQKSNVENIQLIRPKLAYIAARQSKDQAREIVKFFIELVKQIESSSPEKLGGFKMFFEAIVAYHKFYSTKK